MSAKQATRKEAFAIAASPTQRSKLPAYHDIHHRMVEWQRENQSTS